MKYIILFFLFFFTVGFAKEKLIVTAQQDTTTQKASSEKSLLEQDQKKQTEPAPTVKEKLEPTEKNPFKFGLGLLNYSLILNKDFGDKFGRSGWSPYIELAGLFYRHYEIGVHLGMTLVWVGFLDALSNQAAGLFFNYSIMPYLRYYFLEIPTLRPYILGGVGYSKSLVSGLTSTSSAFYRGNSVSTRVGGGIRLVKCLDLGLVYYYAGSLDKKFSIVNQAKSTYYIHLLEFQLAFAFGGNLHSQKNN